MPTVSIHPYNPCPARPQTDLELAAPPDTGLAGLAVRLGVQAISGCVLCFAICLPLHWLWFLPLIHLWTALGLLVASTVLSAGILDQPLQRAHPLPMVAAIHVLVNAALFGVCQGAILARPDRLAECLQVLLLGSLVGAAASVLVMHLVFPITWAAAYIARRASVALAAR